MTDDTYKMAHSVALTPRSFINAFLPYNRDLSVEDKLKLFLREDRMYLYPLFDSIGIFEKDEKFGFENASPAQLLEKLLASKWKLEEGDKDMLVMYHEFEYTHEGREYKVISSMINIGEDQTYTSMSNTVGLPVAIAAKMILTGQLLEKGVTLPIHAEIYEPILNELEAHDIRFEEHEIAL
jgi:saccharopine dehydrogenase-like NADP-dependent oxidoreductase